MIRIEGLSKRFGGEEVLRDVNLEIRDGETLAIIGRSGSGKSVLLKNIIGLLTPDSGRVLVDDEEIHGLSPDELRRVRRKFGVLFQGGALFDFMTVIENVAFPLDMFDGKGKEENRERARELLEMVQLADSADKRTEELSGGQRKRVALARAVALEPSYLFYDEPTSGLDPQTSKTIDNLIQDLAERLKVTSVVVTHDMHSVVRISDRVGFLFQAELRWVGTISELHRSDDTELLDFVRANEYQIGGTHAD